MTPLQRYLKENTEPRITKQELAAQIGVCPSLLTYWQNGERRPGRASIKKIAKATGLKVQDLL